VDAQGRGSRRFTNKEDEKENVMASTSPLTAIVERLKEKIKKEHPDWIKSPKAKTKKPRLRKSCTKKKS
jgi:hypothetical protein